MARRRRNDDDYDDEDEVEDRYEDEDEEDDEEYSRRIKKKKRKRAEATNRLLGPAIALMVMGILGELYAIFNLVVVFFQPFGPIANPFRFGPGGANNPAERAGQMVGAFLPPITILIVLIGAWQMKNAKNYGLAMTAAILACLPCCTPCIILGIPFGIWAVIVLSNRDVSSVFT